MNNFNEWVNALIYLGGNISGKGSRPSNWIDLEKFVLIGTNHMNKNSRVTRCFEHWLKLFGPLLSPSKLRRYILSREISYNISLLGVVIDIIQKYDGDKNKWKIVKEYARKRKKAEKLFSISMPRNCKNAIYKNWNILHVDFIDDERKYINFKIISQYCPELKYRIEGRSIIVSDLLSFIYKTKKKFSIYQIAKEIGHDRSGIKKCFDKNISLLSRVENGS